MSDVQLHLGDCLKFMKTLPDKSVDCVITDPPYGVNYQYNNYLDTKENLQLIIPSLIFESQRIARRVAIFTGIKNLDLYDGFDWVYGWIVPAGSGVSSYGFTCWTPIVFYGKDAYSGKGSYPDVFVDYNPKRTGIKHPCEKPLSIMNWAIKRFSLKNEVVFDPFMGSGTTGVAAIQLGRNFIGCEINPDYFAIAQRRIAEAKMQPSLFEEKSYKPKQLEINRYYP